MLLIVNADDFGYTPGVNRGIVQAVAFGMVSSVSLMVNMPGTEEALGLLRRGAVGACGVHLCLTAGRPVSPPQEVSSLVDGEGLFKKKEALFAAGFNVQEVRREFLAQIKKAREGGVLVTHLDTHHHVHEHPLVLGVLADLAVEYGLPVRATTAEVAGYLSRRGVSVVDFFWGSWYGGGATEEGFWEAVQEGLRRGARSMEIMTHPGLADGELRRLSGYALERERELAVLCRPSLKERLRESGVTLGSYRDLAGLKGGYPA
ncbi:carbohydrate deacetylase [Desulfovirgula thermocuniculi]|uniref:carbohydrate deacetylase n=1 Tax=Desulfovirgula thermocuniculi TaxID=348842 RepID=UPI0004067B39|nr:carbohydrate deacetylase [Desulfovirgula thermocuniculi]